MHVPPDLLTGLPSVASGRRGPRPVSGRPRLPGRACRSAAVARRGPYFWSYAGAGRRALLYRNSEAETANRP